MKKIEVIENILIFISIFSIWPFIFGWIRNWSKFIMGFFLLILLLILISRAKRFRKLLHNLREEVKRDYEKFNK